MLVGQGEGVLIEVFVEISGQRWNVYWPVPLDNGRPVAQPVWSCHSIRDFRERWSCLLFRDLTPPSNNSPTAGPSRELNSFNHHPVLAVASKGGT